MGTDAFDGGGGREITLEAKDRQAVGEGQGGKGEEKDEHRREDVVDEHRREDVVHGPGHVLITVLGAEDSSLLNPPAKLEALGHLATANC